MNSSDLFLYSLHLADTALVLGQRNSEWTGHGPVLEQDIAITNISLDLLGQARNFYQHAALEYNQLSEEEKRKAERYIPRPWKVYNRQLEEDDLAFLRDEQQYLNLLITELPRGDWAITILRQFFLSTFQHLLYTALANSRDLQLAAIAKKSLKETAYHLRWSGEWVVRLGDGTEESHWRICRALEDLWMFTGEMFEITAGGYEAKALEAGIGIDPSWLKDPWLDKVQSVFREATLEVPGPGWMQSGGKEGRHTEHLGYLLAEMQYLQRTFPNMTW